MSTLWIVEQTGGGCTADVARVTDGRTGQDVAVVVTDGNLTALSESDLAPAFRAVSVGVYPSGHWWGEDDDREATGTAWDDGDAPDLTALLSGALSDAGVHLEDTDADGRSATVDALARALVVRQ